MKYVITILLAASLFYCSHHINSANAQDAMVCDCPPIPRTYEKLVFRGYLDEDGYFEQQIPNYSLTDPVTIQLMLRVENDAWESVPFRVSTDGLVYNSGWDNLAEHSYILVVIR